MSLIVTIIILALVVCIAFWIVSIIPFPPPFEIMRTILYILIGVVVIIYLLSLIPGAHLSL